MPVATVPPPTDAPPLDPHPLSAYVSWAGHRNRDPILKVLQSKMEEIPSNPNGQTTVLEVASGSGMHLTYFAPKFPELSFIPTEKTDETVANIRELRDKTGATNVQDPLVLDLTKPQDLPVTQKVSAIFCINIFQVAPISIADGMMQCAAKLLEKGGLLMIYGPFKRDGSFTTQSNQDFDTKLQGAQVDEWGLKDMADLHQAAAKHGLVNEQVIDMPTNNFMLVYKLP